MKIRSILAAVAAPALLLATACNSSDDGDEFAAEENRNKTLAALVSGADDLSTASSILEDANMQSIFDGNTPYSLFAPVDEAFAQIDLPLEEDDARAARVAIMREHIVPGYLTVEDIAAAIESNGGSVEIQTMGSGTLTLSGDADTITITSPGGAQARYSGGAMAGANGAVFPIDAVLKSLETDE